MKAALLSYPMLFQFRGGLQIQILETIAALKQIEVEATLIDPNVQSLADFDTAHVFSASNGNQRIVECAKGLGIPVVVSPLIRPHWNRRLGWLARHLESVVGRLTQWNVKTEYRQIAACLENADALIALGKIEQRSIIDAFNIPAERVRVIPNGIPARFFTSEAQTFCSHFGIEAGFVLSVASVNPHKNQLAAAKATVNSGQRLVVIGPCLLTDRAYLESLKTLPHVTYLGPLDYDSPLLASAYAAAGVFCLPSGSEVMPLSVMESLAAGTPAVMTKNHCMDLTDMRSVVTEVEPTDETALRNAILSFLKQPPAKTACRESVKQFTWEAVAKAVLDCYRAVIVDKA